MKVTMNDIMNKVNQALNYPAISFNDVSHFFDMAISDLNTSLHTSLKPITHVIDVNRQSESQHAKEATVIIDSEVADGIKSYHGLPPDDQKIPYYYDLDKTGIDKLGIRQYDGTYKYFETIYGVKVDTETGDTKRYQSFDAGSERIVWIKDRNEDPLNINMLEFLPADWITLWLIPYVCFKYSSRDGGTATTFAEEYTQGFQQLQNAYDIREKVFLAKQAGRLAYKEDIEAHLPNLNIFCPTRAIYEHMKHGRAVAAKYGSMYDPGGWNDNFHDGGWQR